MSTVSLVNVCKKYQAIEVIHDISLEIEKGSFVVLVGPSGCGKSTLLRMVAGLEEISSGQILIEQRVVNDVPPKDRDIAMVYQNYALYPHMSVAENMGFSLRLARRPKSEIVEKVGNAAKILGLTPYLNRKPSALSGGQRQRVAMGRAIVRNPKVFLFDEPLSNLDAKLRAQMRIDIKKLHNKLGSTTIYVTHDQTEAMTMADKIVVLNGGRVEQIGTPLELYHAPKNLFVAGFIGSPQINLLPGSLAAIRGVATLGVRPEHFSVSSGPKGWPGKVTSAEHLGGDTFIYVDLENAGPVIARTEGSQMFESGQSVFLSIINSRFLHFDDQGNAIATPTP